MELDELSQLSDEELLLRKEKLQKSKVTHAIIIGAFAGVFIFGMVSWFLSDEKRIGFLIPMLIPLIAIRKLLKKSKYTINLEVILKERNLD